MPMVAKTTGRDWRGMLPELTTLLDRIREFRGVIRDDKDRLDRGLDLLTTDLVGASELEPTSSGPMDEPHASPPDPSDARGLVVLIRQQFEASAEDHLRLAEQVAQRVSRLGADVAGENAVQARDTDPTECGRG